MTPMLGADPGSRSGAAGLLDPEGKTVLAWWSWLAMPAGLRLTSSAKTRGKPTVSMHDRMTGLGRAIWIEAKPWDPDVVIEGLYAPRDGKAQDVITLAESTGELRGALGRAPMWRPLASTWRPLVLCAARLRADQAERMAVTAAAAAFKWPSPERPTTKVELGALSEALWIAKAGLVERQRRAKR